MHLVFRSLNSSSAYVGFLAQFGELSFFGRLFSVFILSLFFLLIMCLLIVLVYFPWDACVDDFLTT